MLRVVVIYDALEASMIEANNIPRFDALYTLRTSAKTAVLFGALWGGWAWWINSAHGSDIAMRAAQTQVAFTIVNAFVYSLLMESLFFAIQPVAWRNIITFAIPNAAVTVLLISVHSWRGTPNVLVTSAAPLAIVFALSIVYIMVIGPKRLAAQKHPQKE